MEHRLPEKHAYPFAPPRTPLGNWRAKKFPLDKQSIEKSQFLSESKHHFVRRSDKENGCKRNNRRKKRLKKTALVALIILVFIGTVVYFSPKFPDFLETETNLQNATLETYPETNLPNKTLETNPKNTSLKYVLRGKANHIKFTIFGGLNVYLNELPRSITYFPWEAEPTTKDFVMKFLNEDIQSDYLTELVQKIRVETGNKDDQARIAISLVQQIPYDWEGLTSGNIEDRYPYEVIYDDMGVCGEKSRLLAFLLRELGFDVVLFNFESESHMAAGLKCPVQYSYKNTGYCFIETARPIIITDCQEEYVGAGKLTSFPEIIHISDGFSFDSVSEEYNDAQEWIRLSNISNSAGGYLEETDYNKWLSLVNKYGIKIS